MTCIEDKYQMDSVKRYLEDLEGELKTMLAVVHEAMVEIESVDDEESANKFCAEFAPRLSEGYKHIELFV